MCARAHLACPEWRGARLSDKLRREANDLRHEELGGVFALASRDQVAEDLRRIRWWPRETFGDVRRLPQRELRDLGGELAGRLKGEGGTRRRAIQVRRSARRIRDGGDILDLARDRIRRGIATLVAPATVIVEQVNCFASRSANEAFEKRSTDPPETRMTAGPSPSRS